MAGLVRDFLTHSFPLGSAADLVANHLQDDRNSNAEYYHYNE
jgi:hypothetical protein